MKTFDVIASGYCSMDRIIKIDSQASIGKTSIILNNDNDTIYYGGCSVNVCYALSKLGMSALPLLRVGSDYIDNGFRHYLASGNVSIDALDLVPHEKTSNAYLIEDQESNHITLFHPGAMDGKYANTPSQNWFEKSKIGLMTVASFEDNKIFLEACINNNLPLFLGMKMDKEAFPKAFLIEVIKYSKVIFANESEFECICQMLGISQIEDIFRLTQIKTIVITLGSKGSKYYERQLDSEYVSGFVSACPVRLVIDTVGSGDAYISGFIYGYLNGLDTVTSMQFGSTLASFIIEGVGSTTNTPSLEQLKLRHKSFYRGGKK
ncbi:MAG: PfkB family carbohydrate kinase [Lachnospiraceae bacterium]|jgi:adenosine kinase|nr:PfkB family carbohydrate kinase [Lachnospiraceae bacterium]